MQLIFWPRLKRSLMMLPTVVLCATVACLGQSQHRSLSSPSVQGVTDVISGQNYLQENDDVTSLVVTSNNGGQITSTLNWYGTNTSYALPAANHSIYQTPPQPASSITQQPGTGNYGNIGTGRMFNTKSDQVVMVNLMTTGSGTQWGVKYFDPLTGWQDTDDLASQVVTGQVDSQVVMGNFNGNRLSQALVYVGGSGTPGGGPSWTMQISYPLDPNTEGNMQRGPTYPMDQPFVSGSIAAGDFNGDGRDEIAALEGNGETIDFFTVDPTTYAITKAGTINLPTPLLTTQAALTAGRFSSTSTVTLVAVGQTASGASGISIYPVTPSFSNGQFTGTVQHSCTMNSNASCTADGNYFLLPSRRYAFGVQAAAVNFQTPLATSNQQLVIFTKTGDDGYVDIGSFDITGSPSQFDWQSFTDLEINNGPLFNENMQVGNFDSGSLAPQLSIYFAIGAPGVINSTGQLEIYNVTYSVQQGQTAPQVTWLNQPAGLSTFYNDTRNVLSTVLLPGDMEGRSQRLGSPTIVRIPQQIQPTAVLGMPPMHVDYVVPGLLNVGTINNDSCPNPATDACVLNVSVQPPTNNESNVGFTTLYNLSNTTASSSKSSSTTSYGISAGVTVSESASFSDGEESASESLSDSVAASHNANVMTQYDTSDSQTNSLSTSTGFADYVFYDQKTLNVYYYPVLGTLVCPGGGTNCSPSDMTQQYVEYSVPDTITYSAQDGTTQDWYQPLHEPGSVFSYPPSFSLLGNEYTNTIVPATTPTCTSPGTQIGSNNATWTNASSSSSTSGSTNSFSNDSSFSYSEGVGDVSIGEGASISTTVDFGLSTSLSTLNESTTAQSSSSGIMVTAPSFAGFAAGTCCSYDFASYIYGIQNKNSSIQKITVDDPDAGTQVAVQVPGPLFVGYTAQVVGQNGDCTSSPNAAWWQSVYTKPDVGVNHPDRWTYSPTLTNLVMFNKADPTISPLLQQFYPMKGFFVTLHGEATTSPNLATAANGADLDLTTRVYNYSLVSTTDPVHVRFYGQLYCSSGANSESSCLNPSNKAICKPGTLCGSSIPIGQDQIISSIPGFQQGSDANWTTATVDFNTANYPSTAGGNVYMVFWVLTWMEDSNGHIAPEMLDHGISGATISTYSQITDVPVQTYSNNVGMYPIHTPFYVQPPTQNLAAGTPGSSTSGSLKSVALAVPAQLTLGARTEIDATLMAQSSAVRSVHISYFDGDPNTKGKLIDTQSIAHMDAGPGYLHRAFYKPETCGVHTLYASAFLGNAAAVQATGTTRVVLQPIPFVQGLIARTSQAKVSDPAVASNLIGLLNDALAAFQNGLYNAGIQNLQSFNDAVSATSGSAITADVANQLLAQANTVIGCDTSAPAFSINPSPNARTVRAGAAATYGLNFGSIGGFTGTLTLKCSGAPQGSQCTATPATVQLSSNGTAAASISVSTTSGLATASFLAKPSGSLLRWLFPLFGLLGLAVLTRGRIAAKSLRAITFAILLGVLISATGCGGGSSMQAASTPAGTYSLTVSVSDGTTTQQALLRLVVQ